MTIEQMEKLDSAQDLMDSLPFFSRAHSFLLQASSPVLPVLLCLLPITLLPGCRFASF